ncbi:MAG TPA: hypothetical protein VM307_08995 [Egibacteraceae bacterium]|nr:hypothetical protein [Egibacteraceae bacterium]
MASRLLLRRGLALAIFAAMTVAATPLASASPPATSGTPAAARAQAIQRIVPPHARDRAAVPTDRYDMAGGCYTVRSLVTGGFLARSDDGPTTASDAGIAEHLHFQATDLGRYLLYGTAEDFVAVSEGEAGKALKSATGSSAGAAVGGLTYGTTDRAAEQGAEGPAGTATGRGARVVFADVASELADWEVEQASDGAFQFRLTAVDRVLVVAPDGSLALAAPDGAGDAQRFAIERADGCAIFPEVEVNVDGAPAVGETPFGEVRGYLDAHLHMMAFEFLGGRARCGRPWHPYGVEHALAGCKEHELAGGRAAALETVLSGRDPVRGHDTNAGWPTFTDWPKYNSLTYEQVYYKWLERAWRSGLRMFTNLLVDNNQLCKIYPYKRNSCNEMDGVRLQHQRIHELQDYIDAQYGGPGEGWFRIVTDPFEARRVMNSGRLAVVLGIEVSVLFDCQIYQEQPRCSTEDIDRRLDEVYDLGVRQMELVNKFDNALSGVAGDAGTTGVLVNGGNFLETGRFWRMQTCDEEHGHDYEHAHDRTQYNLHDDAGTPDELTGRDALAGIILHEAAGVGAAPAYPPAPHCNAMGLTPLGEHLIRRMMDKGMIFDPDHMSARARAQAMDVIESEGYSGVVSSHGWADETIYPRILRTGGVVTPYAGTSTTFVEHWRKHKQWVDDRYYFGFGYGADTNGFGSQGAPRGGAADNPVTYPFKGLGGVTVHQQRSGERVYDINVDGVAHYGLYPDWLEDLRRLAGDEILADMQRGPEAYLQMWERAIGVPPDACRADVAPLDAGRMGELRRGMTAEQVLVTLGQPRARHGATFTYCVGEGTATLTFESDGRLHGVEQEPGRRPDRTVTAGADTPRGGSQTKPAATPIAPRPPAVHDHRSHRHGPVELAADVAGSDWTPPAVLFGLVVVLVALNGRQGRRRRS